MNEEEEEEEKIKIEGSIMWGWRKIWATVHNGTEAQMEITKLKKCSTSEEHFCELCFTVS